MNDIVLWYATRGAGIVSLLLLSVVVCLGIAGTLRWQSTAWPRFLTAELHRNVALLAVAFLAVHIVTAVVDPYAALSWTAAFIPFSSGYRTLWLGLGAVALDLLLAVVATSLLRERIGLRAWRAVHWLAYGSWPFAVLHGIGTGSDTFTAWMRLIDVGCIALVLAAVAWRVVAGRPATHRSVGASRLASPKGDR